MVVRAHFPPFDTVDQPSDIPITERKIGVDKNGTISVRLEGWYTKEQLAKVLFSMEVLNGTTTEVDK